MNASAVARVRAALATQPRIALAVPPVGGQAPLRIADQRVPGQRRLDRAGGRQRVAGQGLGRTHGRVFSQHLRDGQALHSVVLQCGGAVQCGRDVAPSPVYSAPGAFWSGW